jgi:hypothetical protein
MLRRTGTPESEECRYFRHAHRGDKTFIRLAAEIDTAVLDTLRKQQKRGSAVVARILTPLRYKNPVDSGAVVGGRSTAHQARKTLR